MDWMDRMSRKELEDLIGKLVAAEVKKQLAELRQPTPKKEQLVDVKAVCKELKVSRQTVNNWRKSIRTKTIIEPCVHRVGGKVLYDIVALREAIKGNKIYFGSGRDYEYKYEVTASEEAKARRKLADIKYNLSRGRELTQEERSFYESHKK